MKNKDIEKEITLFDVLDKGTLQIMRNLQERVEKVEETEQLYFTKILDLVIKDANKTTIEEIAYLIDECTLNNDYELYSIYYIGLWIKLYELVKNNENVPIPIKRAILAREQIKNTPLNLKDQFDKLQNEGKNINFNDTITKFNDILEDKYKNKEDDIFAILGKCFPVYYNENGKALNNKKNIKAILNSWYKLLFEFNIISLNPTKQEKEQICQILIDRCKFSDNILTPRTLFDNEGIEDKLKLEYGKLKKLIKDLITN